MAIQTQAELIVEFSAYVRDICSQSEEEQGNRLETVMARFADSSVRVAASSLAPADLDLAGTSDAELAELMQRHVTFRGGSRLPNSAWGMMLEAARRLRQGTCAECGLSLSEEEVQDEVALCRGCWSWHSDYAALSD